MLASVLCVARSWKVASQTKNGHLSHNNVGIEALAHLLHSLSFVVCVSCAIMHLSARDSAHLAHLPGTPSLPLRAGLQPVRNLCPLTESHLSAAACGQGARGGGFGVSSVGERSCGR